MTLFIPAQDNARGYSHFPDWSSESSSEKLEGGHVICPFALILITFHRSRHAGTPLKTLFYPVVVVVHNRPNVDTGSSIPMLPSLNSKSHTSLIHSLLLSDSLEDPAVFAICVLNSTCEYPHPAACREELRRQGYDKDMTIVVSPCRDDSDGLLEVPQVPSGSSGSHREEVVLRGLDQPRSDCHIACQVSLPYSLVYVILLASDYV